MNIDKKNVKEKLFKLRKSFKEKRNNSKNQDDSSRFQPKYFFFDKTYISYLSATNFVVCALPFFLLRLVHRYPNYFTSTHILFQFSIPPWFNSAQRSSEVLTENLRKCNLASVPFFLIKHSSRNQIWSLIIVPCRAACF